MSRLPAGVLREATIDVGAIAANVRHLRRLTDSEMIAVVKADGYGHGAVRSAAAALEGGASRIGVADIGEALALRRGGIMAPILAWLHAPGASFAEAASAGIGTLFEDLPLPDDLAEAILATYRSLGAPPVAVRSSATTEDLPGASFAGQQATSLNVRGEDELLGAVRRCWASLWSARAIAYRKRQGFHHERAAAVAVVVQRLVPAEVSGVLFTANPVTGARHELVINAALGLGEAVVGGLTTPTALSWTTRP